MRQNDPYALLNFDICDNVSEIYRQISFQFRDLHIFSWVNEIDKMHLN